jgi:6-oxo-cyclohex-1-ene-carbonyl-CoA hydrolase
MAQLNDHDLVPFSPNEGVRIDYRPALMPDGSQAEGLVNCWITLDNPRQLNSYTTEMVKGVILGMRHASNSRNVVAVVFTGAGNRAFCTGGNTKEYAEYYARRTEEYRQYMRLFNDMVSAILHCDKPVICRVNGMRVAGGQEIGMACDFTLASDLAIFGQAGPKHGSAPDGGSTDFLPLFVGFERAMQSCTLCEMWTAYEALRYGLISEAVPVLKMDGKFIPNPTVETKRWHDGAGQVIHGRMLSGEELAAGKALLKSSEIDLTPLDEAVDRLCTKLLMTMPGCLTRTLESTRRHKLAHWDRNREGNRSWLGVNMLGEANLGFRAFNEGARGHRQVDFAELRRAIARGDYWSEELVESLMPPRKEDL